MLRAHVQDEAEFEKAFKASFIVHIAFIIAPVVYAVAMIVLDDMRMKPRFDEELHGFVLGGFAVVSVILLLLRERLATQGARSALKQGQGIAESLAAAHIMRSSMNETVAVLGLVGYLLTANMGVSAAFMGVGLFALVRGRPIKSEWRAAVMKGRR